MPTQMHINPLPFCCTITRGKKKYISFPVPSLEQLCTEDNLGRSNHVHSLVPSKLPHQCPHSSPQSQEEEPQYLKNSLISLHPPDGTHHSPSKEFKIAKLAIVTLAAGVLTLGTFQDASAAKTGGRVGGQAFRSSAPRSSAPRIDRSRTNIYVNPPVAPPLVGGYGFGVPFYGGWGWSPFSYFTPGPSVAIGFGGGFEVFALLLFLSVIAAAIRRFIGPRSEDDDY